MGSPERNAGIGIEGLSASVDNSALWIGFRAPVTGGAALNKALIVQITNIDAVLAGAAAPVFGTSIELDLGGRGIRSIEKNAAGQYIVIAGPAGNATVDVADDFRLYTWNGSVDANGQATSLVLRAVALDALLAGGGSFETIVQVPNSLTDSTYVQLLQDDGGVLIGGMESKDLPPAQQQFTGNFVQIGAPITDTVAPLLVRSTPADNATGASVTTVSLTFNEPVRAGTGNFVFTSGTAPTVTIAANDLQVRYEYNGITITPTTPLQANTTYTLTLANGVVVDAAGNAYSQAGNPVDFTTAAGATIAGTVLAAGDVFFLEINTDDTDSFAFSFVKDIVAGTRISFSDRDATVSGLPATGEAAYVWTADVNYLAGTIVTIQPGTLTNGNPTASQGTVLGTNGGLSATAETVYAFQGRDDGSMTGGIAGLGSGTAGAITVETFLAAINAGGAAAGVIPASIADFAQTFTTDNAVFTGNVNGRTGPVAAAALAAEARNNTNFFTSDTAVSPVTANRVVFPSHAPAGTDSAVTFNEDTPQSFTATDFGFSDTNDTPANALAAVIISTLPTALAAARAVAAACAG